MSTPTPAGLCKTVQRLVEVCRAGQTGFAMAGKAVSEPLLRAELLQYSGQREDFVADLHDGLRTCGDMPSDTESVAHPTHRNWSGLSSVIAGNNRRLLLDFCVAAEAATADEYRQQLANDELPHSIRAVIQSQLIAILRVRDRIVSLRDAA